MYSKQSKQPKNTWMQEYSGRGALTKLCFVDEVMIKIHKRKPEITNGKKWEPKFNHINTKRGLDLLFKAALDCLKN